MALCTVSLLIGIGIDRLGFEGDVLFNVTALQQEVLYLAALLFMSLVLSSGFRQPGLALALPVLVTAAAPLLHLGALAYVLWPEGSARMNRLVALVLWILSWLWLLLVVWRALAVLLLPRRSRTRSFIAALALVAFSWAIHDAFPFSHWWYEPDVATASSRWPSPASEAVLAAQPGILDEALSDLEDERPGTIDLYFVAFAPYSQEDVFRKDVDLARKLMDDRFDTDERSITLINNPRTSLEEPMATASNLRETLNEIGAAIDPEEDVVMLYITSHGSADHRISVEFPPLKLDPITPESLRKMLDESGIKWRILVISTCYSGGFIDALKDEHTLVITAAAANRRSFGCGSESELTYFGDALFNQGLRFEDSFVKAFAVARDYVANKEKAEGQSPPSDPQIDVGAAMPAKLEALEKALRARRSGGSI